jgi:glycosyltransferase involved in cell wall biosynthesis
MRVLVFCTANLGLGSGSEVRARLIAEGLRQLGAEVCVVSAGAPPSFKSLGIEAISLQSDLPSLTVLSSAAAAFAPDVIYGITEGLADLVFKVGRARGCVVAFDMHGIGVVEILELGRGYGPRLHRTRDSLTWLRSMAKADLITVANPKLVGPARLVSRRVHPVVGMTDVSRFTPTGPQVQLGQDPSRIQVLYAGNYFKWQGMELLFAAMRTLLAESPGFEITILGSVGKEHGRGIASRYAFSSDDVHFHDSVPYEQVPDYYRGADVLVIPRPFMLSTYLAFPQKLVDYMATGRAIVATDIAPHRWALESPECGILCKPNPRALARAVERAADAELRSRMGARAREKAVREFSHTTQVERIMSLFRDKLGVR